MGKVLSGEQSFLCDGQGAVRRAKFFYVMGKALSGEQSFLCDGQGAVRRAKFFM